jgi:acyl-[acyl-carrier-protein]-phospholipid O-acyltransferase/long-chain-fatty-acid--[acyl-carrier-protein] ligase
MLPSSTTPGFRESILRLFRGSVRASLRNIKVFGAEDLPKGGFLLLPNHLTDLDPAALQSACPRPIRFIVQESIFRVSWLNEFFRRANAIPLPNVRTEEAAREAATRIRASEVVCIVPVAQPSRPGTQIQLQSGFELIARLAEAPVVPVWLDRMQRPEAPDEGEKIAQSKKISLPFTVAFGKPVPPGLITIGLARERLLELGEFCFQKRPGLDDHLGRVTIRGLRRSQFSDAVIDGMDHRRMKGGTLLAASLALSRWIKKNCSGERIAVVLPPGIGAVIANVAITLANRIPVNLNFTAGRAALQSAIERGQILHAISAKPVINRLQDFPWPQQVYRLEELVPELKSRIVFWRLVVLLAPAQLISALLRLPAKGGRKEAVLLFTSGTAGQPKGVVLSHRNIIANVMQFRAMVHLDRSDTLMASLPFFHCFGCTVTLWHPLMEGVRTVTYPTPVDVVKNSELIQKYRVTLLTTTPTFIRGYLRRSEPKQFASIRLLVAGAEKLPRDLAESFEQRFGIPILEGYGLTETAPVVSVNLPDPSKSHAGERVQPSSRTGSVGLLLPGQAAHIRDIESDELLNPHALGILWLKGPNVFESYLNDPAWTNKVLQNGWFRTGDLARFDEDGFLYIEGRLSRFSKIAGEMVPHETIEAKIVEAFGFKMEEERVVIVVGIPDQSKGESLVLLTTRELSPKDLRKRLLAAGLPSLWIPKVVKMVEQIPLLGTGKLDLGKSRQLAMEK